MENAVAKPHDHGLLIQAAVATGHTAVHQMRHWIMGVWAGLWGSWVSRVNENGISAPV